MLHTHGYSIGGLDALFYFVPKEVRIQKALFPLTVLRKMEFVDSGVVFMNLNSNQKQKEITNLLYR